MAILTAFPFATCVGNALIPTMLQDASALLWPDTKIDSGRTAV